jgi:hypothetical protein
MTCRKARELMALFVGDDLGPRRTRAVRAHLDTCSGCRRELEAFRAALADVKAESEREALPDWSEVEWRALMARATEGTREIGDGSGWRQPRPRWASAAALGVLAGLAALALLVRQPPIGSRGPALAGRTGGAAAGAQDVVSMTMVSQETGLQIVWFFDKNFDYKGERE